MCEKPVITIVEHDPMLGMLLLEVLTDEGYATELWAERAGAFEYIRRTQPDLVVLDLWLHQRGRRSSHSGTPATIRKMLSGRQRSHIVNCETRPIVWCCGRWTKADD